MGRFAHTCRIVGTGMTRLGKRSLTATELMQEALEKALQSCRLELRDLDGLVAVPSLSHPHFMEAHYLATRVGLLPASDRVVRTIDTGGAGPITALLEARRMIINEHCQAVAVVAGDAVSSMDTKSFLDRADAGVSPPSSASSLQQLKTPVIPHGYSRCTEWHMKTYNTTREQLAMVSVLMSRQAARHELALTKHPHKLTDVLGAKTIAPGIGLLECARRADGGAAIIVASSQFLQHKGILRQGNGGSGDVVILGGGEAAGPLYPPAVIDESMYSCEEAAKNAYTETQLEPADIDWWGLYDCFPICFLRAIEAVGLADKGRGGEWIEKRYHETGGDGETLDYDPSIFPVNTHGGLLAFGAPWETPAIYNVCEGVAQLTGSAGKRQVKNARRALVYGNGGIFSASAIALLSRAVD
uniref:Thiolase C-terminal domain-containing protein n=1 Tax=Aplanochytrium stocchinoi TaxID=215587 RepID=A0A7S3LML6_9STRA|mmetsp:Transcript_14473/g.18743  ORF Transcript_14473/g.18743 Transcript_14473/m.18743 type:complete len:414 (+) Transcript_14473:101-1342(+)|eukprot:CAMPEP_0204863622 /NCGR_PEP_ID=MMETSP1348-20121228/3451_1 /ASSEMBLY_ACC=CAM_ASM_000700 /TAXON_ID=215587 /ORGANISM="Aplanochytrium stocchinoi, Strain GSBS06" /LENGTH=413 /DNA_ID=CAMNT_0052014007 /DNA_START=17 /DNA_END=1258 /DNA_ORIENTATION=+